MSDEYTRSKRKTSFKFRNKHAKELKENPQFRLKRVEPKHKLYERYTTQEWMKKIVEKDFEDGK